MPMSVTHYMERNSLRMIPDEIIMNWFSLISSRGLLTIEAISYPESLTPMSTYPSSMDTCILLAFHQP